MSSDDQIMAKIEAVTAAMTFVIAYVNPEAPFSVDVTLKDVLDRWLVLSPDMMRLAFADLAAAMQNPQAGAGAQRLILSLLAAYHCGAGVRSPEPTRSA